MYMEVPVTEQLLARLWCNLWARGIEELARLGFTWSEGFDLFRHHANHATTCGVLCCDDDPVLVAGIVKDGRESYTFMQASRDFDRHARAIVKTLRRRVKAYPEPVYIYSVCVHPDTPRFFQALGFVKDSWKGETATGCPLYRFRRK